MHASAKKESKYELAEDEAPDGRRDHDADWGAKGNGKKKRWWFGYLVHLIDSAFAVTLHVCLDEVIHRRY